MTEDQARDLFRAHCSTGQQGALEAYGERPAIAALMTAHGQMSAALNTLAGSAPVDRPPDPDYSCGNADDVASQASDLAWWFASQIARSALSTQGEAQAVSANVNLEAEVLPPEVMLTIHPALAQSENAPVGDGCSEWVAKARQASDALLSARAALVSVLPAAPTPAKGGERE